MASPFRHFRKHSKALMAGAAVMCMFLFVFSSGTGGGRSRDSDSLAATATVATWNGGSLNQRELASLVGQRELVDEFLQRLFTQGGGRTAYDLPATVPPLLLRSKQHEQIESDVLSTEVLASLAQRAGITVSDEMVNHYLEEFSLNNVSREEIVGILASVGGRDLKQNEAVVFSMLRKMLAAYFYRAAYMDASYVVLPEQRWEDWRNINERISLEVAELPVDSFEKDVPAPSDAALLALYNDYKNADPTEWPVVDEAGTSLPPPTPGFAEPHKVKLEFLSASITDRTGQFLDKVTEEQIVDYYERNKRREFVKTGFGSEEDEPPTPDDDEPAEPESTPADEDAAPSEPADEPPAAEAPAATPESAPAAEAPAPAEPPAATSEAPAPATEANPAAPTEAPASNASSAATRPSVFRLAAYQATPDQPAAESESTPEAPSADQSQPADASAPADETPTPGAEAEPAEASPADAEDKEDKEAADDAKSADDELLEFEPLDKVRDEIRETLARQLAVEELEKVMARATAELQGEYRRYGLAVAMAKEEKKPIPPPPAKLADLQWLADKHKLKFEKTGLLTLRELVDTAVGKAADVQSSRTTVAGAAFYSLNPYEPFLAKELEGDYYLVLKSKDDPERVPEFKEIHDRVLAAYKHEQAATLALDKAKELADQLQKSSQPFKAFFNDNGYEVIESTDLFSRLDFPMGPGTMRPPSLSEVPKLKNVGPEFMDAAFSLKDDEAKAVLNFDHSMAYVIRLHSRQYPEAELKELFLEDEGRSWSGRGEMRYVRFQNAERDIDNELLYKVAQFKLDEEFVKQRRERAQE